MRLVLILPIKLYQKYISPFLAPRCKYYPSCSTYTELAIKEFGLKGLLMGAYRLVRCNPFSHGGVDYPSKSAVNVVRERQLSC
jgi:putative membrane protein insertion efficiency factor